MENNECNFEVYDDNNLKHVTSGPDYGQPVDTTLVWQYEASKKYKNLCFSALSSSILLINVLNILKK